MGAELVLARVVDYRGFGSGCPLEAASAEDFFRSAILVNLQMIVSD